MFFQWISNVVVSLYCLSYDMISRISIYGTEGSQLTAGWHSDLTKEDVQHLWHYNLYSQPGILFQPVKFSSMLGLCLYLTLSQYGITFRGAPGPFNYSQINACIVGIGIIEPLFLKWNLYCISRVQDHPWDQKSVVFYLQVFFLQVLFMHDNFALRKAVLGSR